MATPNNIFSPSSRQADPDALPGHRPRGYYLTIEPRKKVAEGRPACRSSPAPGSPLRQGRRCRQDARLGRHPEPGLRPRHGLRQQGQEDPPHDRRPRDLQPDLARADRVRELPDPEVEAGRPDPQHLQDLRRHRDGRDPRQAEGARLHDRLPGRHLDRDRRHDHPGVEEGDRRRLAQARSPRSRPSSTRASSPTASATTRWSTSGPTPRTASPRRSSPSSRPTRARPRSTRSTS
jgi:hypothetical protein